MGYGKWSKRRWIGIGILTVVIVGVLIDMLRQPGIQDLPGSFEQRAFIRNEQNKGGIVRIYAISVTNPEIADYAACMEQLPHNEYGSITTAYFFEDNASIPTYLSLDTPAFDPMLFEPIAVFHKNEKGEIHKMNFPL